MLAAVLRLCGQPAGGPTGEPDQSMVRVRSPISPPPARKERSEPCAIAAPGGAAMGGGSGTPYGGEKLPISDTGHAPASPSRSAQAGGFNVRQRSWFHDDAGRASDAGHSGRPSGRRKDEPRA